MDDGLPENSNRQHSQSNSDSSQNSERDQNSGESGNTPVHQESERSEHLEEEKKEIGNVVARIVGPLRPSNFNVGQL